ncbi:hypothetical protein PsorP6_016165 [Peronosclerospora sorghi]|uniref:Uncharacterized protein n=1 Tax=Peronosclerospora sorghi TaxID=230839 RepID=A0ACC0VLH2_9STRA|nr:hypothetical protein PsorP6_016165 [Peronosclerospora sorghi]
MASPSPVKACSKVWLVTACSSGFGRAIVLAALARGYRVIATARDVRTLEDLVDKGARALALDVTASDAAFEAVVAQALRFYGSIDVVVNNAALLLAGAIEECSETEVYEQFTTNVFGVFRMVRAVLPHMRAKRSGVVAIMGSACGWTGMATMGVYGSTKFALAGLALALRAEVQPFNIDVTIIEPGSFRTAILSKGLVVPKRSIPDYVPLLARLRRRLSRINAATPLAKQPGDPTKAAHVIVDVLTKTGRCAGKQTLPKRLLLGTDAVALGAAELRERRHEWEEWAALASTTDHDDVVASRL